MSNRAPQVLWADDQTPYIYQPVAQPKARVILAHGAGAGMEHLVMGAIAKAWLALGVEVVRFEFPYMARRRTERVKAPPNKIDKIVMSWQRAAERWASSNVPTILVGKSMGGRAASMLASGPSFDPQGANVVACICLGYPFHPPKKPEVLRVDHLPEVKVPTLIVQGTRDAFGKPEEVAGLRLGERVTVHWLDQCDHDFQPLKRAGITQEQALNQAVAVANEFIQLHARHPDAKHLT